MAAIASTPISAAIKAPVVTTTEVPLEPFEISAFQHKGNNKAAKHREEDKRREEELRRLRDLRTDLDKQLSREKAENAKLKQELADAKKKPSPAPHPILPSGNVLEDVQTHVVCQSWFVQSVHELCEEYKKLKWDNVEKADTIKRQAIAIRELRDDLDQAQVEARENWLALLNEQAAHKVTLDKLQKAENDKKRLEKENARLESDLNDAHTALREKTHRLNEALRDIKQLNTTITYLKDRIVDLEAKLKESNASEDRANDRVAELQRYIYELERKKNALEREKDSEQEKKRTAESQVQNLQRKIDDLTKNRFRISGAEADEVTKE